jgi:hypothetical protein
MSADAEVKLSVGVERLSQFRTIRLMASLETGHRRHERGPVLVAPSGNLRKRWCERNGNPNAAAIRACFVPEGERILNFAQHAMQVPATIY